MQRPCHWFLVLVLTGSPEVAGIVLSLGKQKKKKKKKEGKKKKKKKKKKVNGQLKIEKRSEEK